MSLPQVNRDILYEEHHVIASGLVFSRTWVIRTYSKQWLRKVLSSTDEFGFSISRYRASYRDYVTRVWHEHIYVRESAHVLVPAMGGPLFESQISRYREL